MQIDFETFLSIVNPVLDARMPVLIRGRHGIGKSEVVYQTAKARGLRVVERRASQMTEGDLVGLPSLSEARTRWNPPDWFKVACEEPVMVFLDEIDRATIEVRQGIFEMTDSRKLNGFHLHPDTLIMAAVNGGEDGAMYQVGEMDPAELDRWTTFDLSPTVEDWINWGKQDNNIHPVVLDFINQNREHLEHKGDFEPNKKYPSRRSWKRYNDVLCNASMLDNEWEHKVRILALGFLGDEAAIAFSDFYQKYDRQVTPDDILNHGKHDLVKDFGLVEHVALIDKFDTMGLLKKKLAKKQIQNLGKYIMMCPSEAAMKLWTAMGAGPRENTMKLHAVEVDGETVHRYFAKIAGAGKGDS
jgi:hypothetical protein